MRERITYLDTAKGIGIILLIAGHTFPIYGNTFNFIFSFHMPLFFIISGALANFSAIESNIKYIKKAAKSCLIPFVAFTFFGFLITYTIPALRAGLLADEIVISLYRLQPESFYVGQLWFLIVLFEVKLMFLPFYKYILSKKNAITNCISIGILLFVATMIRYFVHYFPYETMPFNIASSFMALFFYTFGYVLFPKFDDYLKDTTNHKKIAYSVALLFITVLLSYYNGSVNICELRYNDSGFYLISSLAGTISTITLSSLISNKVSICNYIGKHSLPIFAMHSLILLFYALAFSVMSNELKQPLYSVNNCEAALLTILTTITTTALVALYNMTKKLVFKH